MPEKRPRNHEETVFARLAWLWGIIVASAAFLCLWFFFDLRFANNDDTYILRMTMGYAGELPTFNMCLHFVLLYPLRWLTAAFPGVAWFSWMQLFFLWLSAVVSLKALLQAFRHADKPVFCGMLAAVLYLAVFVLPYGCNVTFTVTAAALGGAAVLQLLSIDGCRYGDGQVFRALVPSLLLVVFAYGLRQIAAVPILAFCAVALLLLYLRGFRGSARQLRPLACGLLAAALLLGGLAGLREWEIQQKDVSAYLRWQKVSGDVLDYHPLDEFSPQTLADAGWTENLTALVSDWYFMDASISVEAFEKLSAALEADPNNTLAAKLQKGWQVFSAFPAQEPYAAASMVLLLLMALLCSLGLFGRKEGRGSGGLCLLLGLLGALAFLAYLSVKGRLPLRALLMVALPFGGLCFGLLPACLPESPSGFGRASLALLAAALFAYGGWYALPELRGCLKPAVEDNAETGNPYQDLDEFAMENQDFLLIYDGSLSADLRMFPETSFGIPGNLLFWGGWGTHSPEYNAQLRRYGFDPKHWSVTDFLSENVRLMRGVIDPPPNRLLNHLNDTVSADCLMDSEYGYVYSYEIYEE